MSAREDGGLTYRETLMGLIDRSRDEKRIAEYEAELAGPPLPPEGAYLWRAFLRMRRRKGGNGFSAMPIEWPDIDAFCRNARMRLLPWELETIEALDDLYLRVTANPAKT